MRRFLLVLLAPILLLSSCNNIEPSTPKEPYYEEAEAYHMNWKDLFNIEKETYYAYIYGIACPQCSALREDIVSLAKQEVINLYFIYPSDDLPFIDDKDKAEASIGADKLENVYLYSTPTLFEVNNKKITSYSRDYSTIRHFIDSYINS